MGIPFITHTVCADIKRLVYKHIDSDAGQYLDLFTVEEGGAGGAETHGRSNGSGALNLPRTDAQLLFHRLKQLLNSIDWSKVPSFK